LGSHLTPRFRAPGTSVRFSRAMIAAMVLYAAVVALAAAALFAAAGWPRRFPELALPLLGVLLVAAAAPTIIARRLAEATARPLRELAAAAWSGVEGRLRPAHEASREALFDEVREAVEAFNAMTLEASHTIAELEFRNSTLESVLAHMSDALLVLDGRGALTLVNPAAERFFGITAPSAIGRRLIEVFRHFELDALVRQAERQRRPYSREIELHHPEQRLLRVQANPVTGPGGEFLGVVVVAQDVTEQRRTDTVRREFVANVSHELRTPLTSVRALAEALAGGAAQDAEAGPRFLDQILAEIDRLTLLVNDLLDLSAIESGSAKLDMEPVPLGEVIDDVVTKFRSMADRRGIALHGNGEPGPLRAWADRGRVTQAVANLVDNAIKYTPDGGTVRVEGEARNGMVAISVADTGIGIAPEHLPRIFERFYRVDRSRSRALGGTGLGLSIVKHIATSHGGDVEVKSVEGRGTRFSLLLPRAPV
jgi:two-component system, OmpR family, phosphate regulon sensor histidine kinase PhoR